MHAAIRSPRATLASASVFVALNVCLQAQAGVVSVTGAFTSITPDAALSQSTVTSHLASGPTTQPLRDGETTLLPAGTSNIDYEAASGFFINSFRFTPGDDANVNRGDIFRLGSFTFTNGTWFVFTEPDGTRLDTVRLRFSLTTHSSTAELDNHVFSGTINMVVNPNDANDPYVSADYFYVAERPDLGSVRVFERNIQPSGNPGSTGTAEFYGQIGSLIPTSFSNPSGGAFLSPSVGIDPLVNPVPEPGILSLTMAGLGWMFMMRQKPKARTGRAHA